MESFTEAKFNMSEIETIIRILSKKRWNSFSTNQYY